MAYVHVAHDCIIGDYSILSNGVQLGGHVEIGNHAIIGGMTPVHQFCKIGDFAFIGGGLRIVQDVPPFILAMGEPLKFSGLNSIGLRRNNFSAEIRQKIKKTFDKLGISIEEQKKLSGVAVDIVMDSVSVATSFKETLSEKGIIFCSISDAIKEHPELVKKYLGSVVPTRDNFFSALNSAVFSDGSFCYIPKGVKCPMELSTYFRINEAGTGQFERTLLIADEGSQVSYLEGCTAPMRDENQLHAAVVELVAMDDADIKYSTVQNLSLIHI